MSVNSAHIKVQLLANFRYLDWQEGNETEIWRC